MHWWALAGPELLRLWYTVADATYSLPVRVMGGLAAGAADGLDGAGAGTTRRADDAA